MRSCNARLTRSGAGLLGLVMASRCLIGMMICSLRVRRGCFLGGIGLSSSRSRLILTPRLSVADLLMVGEYADSALNRATDAVTQC